MNESAREKFQTELLKIAERLVHDVNKIVELENIIIPSNGYVPTPSCEASQRETESALSSHCSKSTESYTLTSFQ